MWKLQIPETLSCADDLEKALRPDNGSIPFQTTPVEDARIFELYQKYDDLQGQPNTLLLGTDLRADLLNAIHDSYELTQKNRRLKKIREDLKLNIEKCPYCGVGELTDLDHHIPKSKYKAHSIYIRNLIPCCHPCNKIKSSTAEEIVELQFLHTYFGDLPREPFFFASINMTLSGFTAHFQIIKSPELNNDEFERLKFQIDKLHLNTRYNAAVVSFLAIHKTSIEMMGDVNSALLRDWLVKARDDSSQIFGINHWQTALLRALAESDEFCQGGYRCAFGLRDFPT